LGLAGLLLLGVSGLEVRLPEKNRTLSFAQLIENVGSVAGGSEVGDLEGTKQWRLNWWNDIIDYTVHGPYFWTGKGFGVNLADDDGYQGTDWDGQLRSPHNGHLTMLARAGVPGFILWVVVQVAWATGIVRAGLRARLGGQVRWAGLFVFLFAYWAAMMTRAGFDVYLEGPMGGIWFWTIFGIGLAALWIYRHQPHLLESPSENPLRA
jgi:O-antigen ligase